MRFKVKKSVEVDQADEDDDVPIANIMKRTIESLTKPQEKFVAKEVKNVDEETESDEEPVVEVMKSITRSMADGVKEKRKDVSPKTFMKNNELVKKKTPQRKPVSKKRKVQEKTDEKESLKRKLAQSSQTDGGNSSPVSKTTRTDVLLELMEVSKAMQETITANTIRKRHVVGLIKMMSKEKEDDEE
ncbi:hypothetical protein KIW84_010244 [Lathyrus oleraceus]|uniref:Uncharacterized protein n=1 Tax=Pisum sativum TaxID=3888 RepID=A0A9D5BDZ6_PEA|nr:hypothetical protein KIW84_010244 [Pisum sativum]